MTLPLRYYEENLYPLQDGVMNILSHSGTDFFLTGGTALSRAYYNHRYSDDLDFFVNQSQSYDEQIDKVFALLRENGFFWNVETEFTRAKNFATVKVRKDTEAFLKLDFVNDLVPHYGEINKTGLFYKTDISEVLTGIPQSEFETIAWVKKPEWEVFCGDIERIVLEMMSG